MNRNVLVSLLVAWSATTACLSSDQRRRREYDAQYQQAVQLCGHPDVAYQAGYNAGYAGDRMEGDRTAMCVPTVQAQTSSSYQAGFLEGAKNAPIRVVHTITPTRAPWRTRSVTVSECTFDSDCGDGFHCRDHECMGFGAVGDRCVFNEDCVSDDCFGRVCRE